MKLFKDYAVLAGGQVAGKIVAFLAFAWLARVLDPVGYGAVEYVVGLTLFFSTLIDGGLGVIGVRRSAHDPAALPTLAFQIRIARLFLALIAVPIMVLLASTMKSAAPLILVWLFALSLLTLPWRQEWLLQATERMADAALAQFLRMAAFAVLVFTLVDRPQQLVAVGWAELGAAALMSAYCVYIVHTRVAPLSARGSMKGFPALLTEGTAVGAGNIAWAMNLYAPLFLIGTFIGGTQTAWFAAASRVIGSLLVFSYVYHYSLYPAVTRATARKDGELARLLAGSCRVTAWAGVLAALALTLLAEPLIVVALGAKMAPAAPMLQVMAWMLPVALCSGHARWSLAAAGLQTRVLGSQAGGLATTVVVALLVGPRMGGPGYAIAALAGFVAVWGTAHGFAARAGLTPPPLRLLLLPALVAAAIAVAHAHFGWGPWGAIAGVALFALSVPLVDRRFIADMKALGHAKLARGGSMPVRSDPDA
ncbi:MAG: oligosaccharide flippase family protein [Betaproteobacteria bacterium]